MQTQNINTVAPAIKLLALDVDGVLTDGSVTYSNLGDETKSFNIKDGLGIKLAQRAGIEVVIITGRTSKLLERRASELGIEKLVQGREDKLTALNTLIEPMNIGLNECAYMGDDLPDLSAIHSVALGTCPADAVPDVRETADWVSSQAGGRGAVRELIEAILRARGDWDKLLETYR